MTTIYIQKLEQIMFDFLKKQNQQLLYYRKVLMPTLELQIRMEEVAAEEHDYVHFTWLKGLQSQKFLNVKETPLQALSHFTGLALPSIEEKAKELYALGYLERCEREGYSLTELAERSLQLGKPIKQVMRSLRMCAITGRLLPRVAYDIEFKSVNALSERDLNFVVVAREEDQVDLWTLTEIATLDIPDKHALNIPDEVQQLVSVESYQSGFQLGQLVVSGNINPEHAWIQYNDMFLDYEVSQVPQPHERFGKKATESLDNLTEKLKEEGVELTEPLMEDKFGVLTGSLKSASEKWLGATTMSFYPNILRCTEVASPFYRYPLESRDLLEGRAFYLCFDSMDPRVLQHQALIKEFYQLRDAFFKQPFGQRTDRKLEQYMFRMLPEQKRRDLLALASRYKIKKMAECLHITFELEDA